MIERLKGAAVPLIAMSILLAFWFGLEVEHRQHVMAGDDCQCQQPASSVHSH
jgi:hypothetical protein